MFLYAKKVMFLLLHLTEKIIFVKLFNQHI